MYTGVFDQNCTRNFYRSISYPIGPRLNLYTDNKETIKILLVVSITPQDRHLEILINALRYLNFCNVFDMVNIISKIQLTDLNYKPHGSKIIRNLIDLEIGVHSYPQTGSEHLKFFALTCSIYPLTIKCNHVINQMKNNEVYNVKNFCSL